MYRRRFVTSLLGLAMIMAGGRGERLRGLTEHRCKPATPFGGTKQSGFGREGGRAGIEEMVQTKTVYTDP